MRELVRPSLWGGEDRRTGVCGRGWRADRGEKNKLFRTPPRGKPASQEKRKEIEADPPLGPGKEGRLGESPSTSSLGPSSGHPCLPEAPWSHTSHSTDLTHALPFTLGPSRTEGPLGTCPVIVVTHLCPTGWPHAVTPSLPVTLSASVLCMSSYSTL